jgi:RNA polymerase sigma-70 factor (ECF subfamily)
MTDDLAQGGSGASAAAEVDGSTSAEGSRLSELYQRHVGRMVGLARLLTGDQFAAEDIAHDAFIRAASRLGAMRDPERFEAYALRAVVNLCRSRGRHHSVERAWLRRARPAEDARPPATEERDAVWAAVLALPQRQREAVVLRFYEDLSEERVAQLLACSQKAVNGLIDRAKPALRAALGTTDEEDSR